MSFLHIYSYPCQPLTRWRIGTEILDKPSPYFRNSPYSTRYWCDSCYRTRQARNLQIQVYYDCNRISCRGGCKPSTYKERTQRLRALMRRAAGKGESS